MARAISIYFLEELYILMPKVLLIEDDELIYAMYQKAFTLAGIEIELAKNGQIGLEKVHTSQPDLILLDVMMPKMNGIEVLEKLKTDPATNHIPVVMLTNVSEFQIMNHAIAEGATQYIVKSDTEPQELVNLARNIITKNNASSTDAIPKP
jgi:CheY-like chemotaxis protein